MNFLQCSPISASIFCSSEEVPSVVTTSAWVSPRVKSAEPWVRGSTSTSHVIGRTSVRPRPSRRRPSSTIVWRTTCFLSRSNSVAASLIRSGSPLPTASATSARAASSAAYRSCLAALPSAARSRGSAASRTAASSTGFAAGAGTARLGLPASRRSSSCTASRGSSAAWAVNSASRTTSSGSIFAPPSTITIASRVPATTRSMSLSPSCAVVGLMTKRPPTRPTRTAATGPPQGMSERVSAAEAPTSDHVGVVLPIVGEHRGDHLGLAVEALRKQGPHRAIDEARGEDLLLRGAPLALEEATRDLSRRERLLDVVAGEREEVDTLARRRGGGRRDEDHGLAELHEHGAARLLGQATRLDQERPPVEFDLDPMRRFCHGFSPAVHHRSVV